MHWLIAWTSLWLASHTSASDSRAAAVAALKNRPRVVEIAHAIERCQPGLNEASRLIYAGVVVDEAKKRRVDDYTIVALVDEESSWREHAVSPDGEDYGLGGIRARNERACRSDRDPLKDPSAACEQAQRLLLDGTYNLRRTIGAFAEVRDQCRKITGIKPEPKHILAAYGGMNDPETDTWCGRRKAQGRWRSTKVHPRIAKILARARQLRSTAGGRPRTGRSRKTKSS